MTFNPQSSEYSPLTSRDTLLSMLETLLDALFCIDDAETEEGLRVLIDTIPQFVWMMRPDGSCEYCNQRWCDSTNMTSEQAQGDGWLQAIHPDDQQRVLERWQSAVQTGRPYEAELRLRHGTTGEYHWFLARGVPHRDDQGTILKWFGTATDIEDQKRVEQQLKESKESE
ncbi:PAS domain-containing protein [Ktedonobacter robiniae]|uniref:histidine kinase n=1 Tax=Ktedonobacter robiniae TaxID=2778365 RepID=A0ABQ3V7D2_9CHLR|nr:PAS domain-containing protein [Ktedonobacter robiniae]GHO60804.1 hypothetical protein KSB_92790 [Ktedonobacter robiniae]